jgi:para-nitrobenzyl esterase
MRSLLFILCASCGLAQNQAAVRIDSGLVAGKETAGVRAWLGIPYAAPPVGALRWRPPQAPAKWDGVRATGLVGPACIQGASGGVAAAHMAQSEDCLTLNVWAPKNAHQAAVMVWIHGGGFVSGSGGLPIYDGAALAHKGVVVVTFNYRLGDLGFFAHPDLTRESPGEPAANFGLMDQIAALRWVRQNVAAFGGDPGKVTVFGESAGAMSVYLLMISPQARGLFARAIAESGPVFGPMRTVADLERAGTERAGTWGAANLEALRALPAQTFTQASLRGAGPAIDGKYVAEGPREAFAAGRQAPVPFLLGANSFEASLMGLYGVAADRFQALLPRNGGRAQQLYGNGDGNGPQIFTDAGFLEPTRFLAARMEKVAAPAYLYYFSYVAERRRAGSPGAPHGGEIRFVFGNGAAGPLAQEFTDADRLVADRVSGYWVNFATTGDPNGSGLPAWPAFRAATGRLLEMGPEFAVRERFRQSQLDWIEQAR